MSFFRSLPRIHDHTFIQKWRSKMLKNLVFYSYYLKESNFRLISVRLFGFSYGKRGLWPAVRSCLESHENQLRKQHGETLRYFRGEGRRGFKTPCGWRTCWSSPAVWCRSGSSARSGTSCLRCCCSLRRCRPSGWASRTWRRPWRHGAETQDKSLLGRHGHQLNDQ